MHEPTLAGARNFYPCPDCGGRAYIEEPLRLIRCEECVLGVVIDWRGVEGEYEKLVRGER